MSHTQDKFLDLINNGSLNLNLKKTLQKSKNIRNQITLSLKQLYDEDQRNSEKLKQLNAMLPQSESNMIEANRQAKLMINQFIDALTRFFSPLLVHLGILKATPKTYRSVAEEKSIQNTILIHEIMNTTKQLEDIRSSMQLLKTSLNDETLSPKTSSKTGSSNKITETSIPPSEQNSVILILEPQKTAQDEQVSEPIPLEDPLELEDTSLGSNVYSDNIDDASVIDDDSDSDCDSDLNVDNTKPTQPKRFERLASFNHKVEYDQIYVSNQDEDADLPLQNQNVSHSLSEQSFFAVKDNSGGNADSHQIKPNNSCVF